MPSEFDNLVPVRWNKIDAVVFDIGGVLTIRHAEPVTNGMARGGFNLPADSNNLYFDAHYTSVRALTDAMSEGMWDETTLEFWICFEKAYLRFLGVEEDRLDAAVEVMFAEVFGKEPGPVWRLLLQDNIDALHSLAETSMPIAIVSNNDGSAEQQMVDFGVCQVGVGPLPTVAAVVDSGVLKISKPDPRIFVPALEALGTAASRTLYVGDTVHADVLGATRAGMPVVQLDPLNLHAHFGHTRLPDVASILDALATA